MENFKIPLFFNERDIEIEKQQLIDEGKNIKEVEEEFERIKQILKENPEMNIQKKVEELFDRCSLLPIRKGYPYVEPVKFGDIKRELSGHKFEIKKELKENEIKDKIEGGWFGRCAGCLLGKPVEGWGYEKIKNYLSETGNYPLNYYISPFINNVKHMVEDDDINYTVLALTLVEKYGREFTSEDFAINLIQRIPILRTCTAERITYKNLVNLISPEISAFYRNPYREWIGAQIRADFYGYINPGEPENAIEMAYKDARVSHIKNGVYGAMWVSALISIAFYENQPERIIEISLNFVPSKSRFSENIKEILGYYKEEVSYYEVVKKIHEKWDEKNPHHWCHVISNAQIVAIGLLWGEGDFGKSICRAVEIGFDTDCNGATVGSVMGVILGKKDLPEKWILPLNNIVETGVVGYSKVKISELSKKTYEIYRRERKWKK